MSYIDSNNISVFPSALRTKVGDGKFTSEDNLTGIIRNVTGKDSFYKEIKDGSSLSGYVFVIHGYYFEISTNTVLTGFANIIVDSSNRLVGYNPDTKAVTTALDNSSSLFVGLWISTTKPSSISNYTIYSLELVEENKLYLDANTIFNLDNVTVGAASKLTSTVGDSNRSIYLSSGVPTAGKGIFVTSSSASEPSGSLNGDIWLKY